MALLGALGVLSDKGSPAVVTQQSDAPGDFDRRSRSCRLATCSVLVSPGFRVPGIVGGGRWSGLRGGLPLQSAGFIGDLPPLLQSAGFLGGLPGSTSAWIEHQRGSPRVLVLYVQGHLRLHTHSQVDSVAEDKYIHRLKWLLNNKRDFIHKGYQSHFNPHQKCCNKKPFKVVDHSELPSSSEATLMISMQQYSHNRIANYR